LRRGVIRLGDQLKDILLKDITSKILPVSIASYIIYTDGKTYYAKNSDTGATEYSDADATKVIQYAIDKVITMGGGTVLLRDGKYYLSNTINIQNAVGVELRGMGMGRTVLTPNTDDPSWAPVIFMNNSNYIRLTGFTIDQRRTKTVGLPDVVFIVNSNYVEVSHLEITRYFPFALSFGRPIITLTDPSKGETPPFSPVSNIYVHHNFIHDAVQDCGGDGIKTYATKNAVITDNIILNSGDDCISIGGMQGYESHNYVIANNITAPGVCGNSIKLHTIYNQPPGDYPIRNVVIANNISIPGSAGTGAIITSWESSQTTNNPIADVVIEGNRVERIRISGATRVHINGNIVGEEILLFPSTVGVPQPMSDILITNNRVGKITIDIRNYGETQFSNIHVKGNVINSTGTAIFVGANQIPISYLYIEGNHIVGTRGVQIEGAVGADYVYIFRNRFIASDYDLYLANYVQDHVYIYDNDFSYRIYDYPGRARYRRNRGYLTENSGVATISAGSTRVTVSHGLAKTPTKFLITPLGQPPGKLWVENITSTSFDIVTDTAPTVDLNISWYAEV